MWFVYKVLEIISRFLCHPICNWLYVCMYMFIHKYNIPHSYVGWREPRHSGITYICQCVYVFMHVCTLLLHTWVWGGPNEYIMHACMFLFMYVCVHDCTYVCICACPFVCMYVCMYVCVYVCMYILCMYVCIYTYKCMYVCIYRFIQKYNTPDSLVGWRRQRCGSVLQCVAVHCSVLQCIAVCCSVLQWASILRWMTWNKSRQCVAVWCSVLQCGAVCCSEPHPYVGW